MAQRNQNAIRLSSLKGIRRLARNNFESVWRYDYHTTGRVHACGTAPDLLQDYSITPNLL